MTWTWTRATCTTSEHERKRAVFVTPFDVASHAPRGSSLSLITCHPCTCASLLDFRHPPLLLRSVLHRPLLSSSLSCTSSCTLSSTTWSPCKTCAPPRTRGVTTPTTSPTPSQVMSPTTWPSASSTTSRVPSPTSPRHQTRTWMTRHSASCSPRHTEDKPITAIQKARQSVSRRCLLCLIEQGNLWEKEMSIKQLVLVSRETRTVLTAVFLKTPKLKKWSIEQGNLWSEIAQMHRLGLYLMNRHKWLSQNVARKLVITNSMQLMPKKNAEFYEKNYGDSKWIFVKFINKVLQRWRNYENSKVLPSTRWRDESSSRTRTLFWNYQEEYKNYKMK